MVNKSLYMNQKTEKLHVTTVKELDGAQPSIYSRYYQAITGIKMSPKKMIKAGHRIHTLERFMNSREGISRKDDTLPARFLMEGRLNDPQNHVVPLKKMLDQYYRLRGYDKNGVPKIKTLKKYDIDPR